MAQEKKTKNMLAMKFAGMAFFASVLLFMGGFFYGTHTMDSTALFYSLKQVFIPAAIIGCICFWIGRILDNAGTKKSTKKKKNAKVKY